MCVEKTPWEQVIDFHGHSCPEIAVGFRVAQLAQRELGIRPALDSVLMVTAETYSCALDAFQVLNHATVGRGTLRIEEKGRQVYYFYYSGTKEFICISVKGVILQRITPSETFSSPRQRQNWALENIQYVLSSNEEEFCSIQRISGELEGTSSTEPWMNCSVCQVAVREDYAIQSGGKVTCQKCNM